MVIIVILAMLIIVASYVKTGFNVHYFHTLNVIFFLTFIVSMCGFLLDNQERQSRIRERVATIALQKLYDAETDPSDPYKTMLCIETILCLGNEIPDGRLLLNKRLHRLVIGSAFRAFWTSDRATLYPPSTQAFVSRLQD